jgi:hypothetical protein
MPDMPRSALSRLPGEAPSALGHNGGPPLDPDRRWRAVAWGKARRDLVRHLPIEIVRRRVARARDLGLAYPAYAAILMGTGRDIVGFLFTAEAIGLRLERAARIEASAARKLAAVSGAQRLLLGPPVAPADLRDVLSAQGLAFDGIGAAPPREAPDALGKAAIRALLDPLRLPGDAVVMVGARPDERRWAEAARLARFIAAPAYFAPLAGAPA